MKIGIVGYSQDTIDLLKLNKKTNIYIVDTLGELGLFFSIANVIFMGGSLVDVGGHNPLEPAKLGKAVITGPYIKNNTEIFEDMIRNNACIKIINENELFEEVKNLFENRIWGSLTSNETVEKVQE